MPGRRLAVAVERVLFVVGVACLGVWAAATVHARWVNAREGRRFDRIVTERSGAFPTRPGDERLIGRIEVPRVGISTVILEGDDEATLADAVGHIPGTPMPGGDGNAGLAAHRDGLFRPLRRIRRGDVIRVRTRVGTFRYVVDSLGIVAPSDVAVLRPTDRPTLTLVTCYPFRYVGPAPFRFVVTASMASSSGALTAASRRHLAAGRASGS